MDTTTATISRMTVTTARMAIPLFGAGSPERIAADCFSGCRLAAGGFGAAGGASSRRGTAAGFSGGLSAAGRLTFGKYAGHHITEVDDGYLTWLADSLRKSTIGRRGAAVVQEHAQAGATPSPTATAAASG